MADKLDGLIEWLVDEVVYSGPDGIPVLQLLARAGTFDGDADKPTRTLDGSAHQTREQNKLAVDDTLEEKLWKCLAVHQDILVGEDRSSNHLTLSELKALHHESPTAQTLPVTDEQPSSNHEGATSRQDSDNDPLSPSAQLHEQIQSRSVHEPAAHEDRENLAVAKSTSKGSVATDRKGVNSLSYRDEVGSGAFREGRTPEAIALSEGEPQARKVITPHPDAIKQQPRIYASKTRIWMTIVGFKPNFRQIRKPQWESLYTIAQARGKGISLQHLLQLSTQDEKTLSLQLSHLVRKGYIVRKQIPPRVGLGGAILFFLKKFSDGMITTTPEPTIYEDVEISDIPLSLLKENETVVCSIPAADGSSETSAPKPQASHYDSQLPNADESLSSSQPQKAKRGRPKIPWATHTTYDECQIADGVPGVYRDVTEFYQIKPKLGARPKSEYLLLFKSEKLKKLPWFHNQSDNKSSGEANTQEPAPSNSTHPHTRSHKEDPSKSLSTKRSRTLDADDCDTSRPFKRAIIDNTRGINQGVVHSHQIPAQPILPAFCMTSNQVPRSIGSPSVLRNIGLTAFPISSKPYVSPYAPSAPSGTPSVLLTTQTIPTNSEATITTQNTTRTSSETPVLNSHAPTVTKSSYAVKTRAAARALSMQHPLGKEQARVQVIAQPALENGNAILRDERPETALRSSGEKLSRYHSTISASHNGITGGGLCLSIDRKSLIFLADIEQPDSPSLHIQISEIKDPPENFVINSNTMELRIAIIDENETDTVHSFQYLPTDAERGNVMRANIVTAMTISNFENDEASLIVDEKPFKCDQCGGSWKNQEGIKYHLTRSQTICNPQFTLSRKSRKAPTSTKRKASLEDDENGIAADGNLMETSNPNEPGATVTKPARRRVQANPKSNMNAPKATMLESPLQKIKNIILALLDAHDEVFPGECSLWRAHEAVWMQVYPEFSLPDRNFWDATFDSLVNSGHVRSMQFSFKDEKGLMRMRTIVTKNCIDPASSKINEIKELMKAVFPDHYHPPPTVLLEVIQSLLKAREDQNITETGPKPRQTRSGRIIKEVQKVYNFDDELFQSSSESDETGSQIPATKEAFNSIVGNEENSDRSTSFSHTQVDETDSDFVQPRKRRRLERQPVNLATRVQPWQPAIDFMQNERGAWSNLAQPQRMIPIRIEKKPIGAKMRAYRGRVQMPEPITYMQTMNNSAWAFRPYGHGVRPIHARPSLRVSKSVAYLEKIEQGFRPILMPKSFRSRPDISSRITMSRDIGKDATGSVEGTHQKRMRSPSTVSENGNETLRPTKKRRMRQPMSGALLHPLPNSFQSPTTFALHPAHAPLLAASAKNITHLPPGYDPSSLTMSNFVLDSASLTNSSQPVRGPSSILEARNSQPSDQILLPNPLLGDNTEILGPMLPQNLDREGEHRGNHVTGKRVCWWDENPLPPQGLPNGERQSNDSAPTIKAKGKKKRAQTSNPLKTVKIRRLTALPGDLGDMAASIAAYPDLAVEVALDHHQNKARRRRKGLEMSKGMEKRIKVAVVVIRTLTGGLDKAIDWVLVSKLFPEVSMNSLQNIIWPPLAAQHKLAIERLGREFEDFFIKAYEDGQVPPINYDHLVDYDWELLVNLVIERVVFDVGEVAPNLPASRSELEESYEVSMENQQLWRDDFFNHIIPVYKRVEKSSLEQATTPSNPKSLPQQVVDDLTVARSWARANVLTPQSTYDPSLAQAKLSGLPNGLLKIATNELIARKVLTHRNKGRPVPGRGFDLSDVFATSFRKHLNEQHLSDAYAFKISLDRAFLFGEKVMVDWAANEGDILAMTNLQAQGCIDLMPGNNVPADRFGLIGAGNYQTKKMPKSALRFDIEIRPTASYLYTLQIPILSKAPSCLSHPNPTEVAKPPHGINGAIPLWYDINGHLIKDWWKKVLCTVLGTVAMRPGIGAKELARLFAPALEEWEIRVLMEWGCAVGALVDVRKEGDGLERRDRSAEGEQRERDGKEKGKVKEGENDHDEALRKSPGAEGWSTGEWWWVFGGRDW